ncbi:hypothetical protein GGR58DRAFT_509229 [Xylaria digitata]|nr:hypothetical protein GGR58DRAFT_509229 [Xylaria digitata]
MSPNSNNHSATSPGGERKGPEREIGETTDDPVDFPCSTGNGTTNQSTTYSASKRTKSSKFINFVCEGHVKKVRSCCRYHADEIAAWLNSQALPVRRESTPAQRNPDAETQPANLADESKNDSEMSGYEADIEGNRGEMTKQRLSRARRKKRTTKTYYGWKYIYDPFGCEINPGDSGDRDGMCCI